MEHKPIYYSEYLQLDKILNAQAPESSKAGIRADDEMLFIIIHQSYELWFKQIMHEVNIAREVFRQPQISDNSPELMNVVHRLRRVTLILQMLVDKMDIIETMTPLDFLDFRDLLRPASGFQSIQFKQLEAALGLKFEQRFGQNYYTSQLNEGDINRVKDSEKEISLLELVNNWLERMPFFDHSSWQQVDNEHQSEHPFWQQYKDIYFSTLQPEERQNDVGFNMMFMNDKEYPAERRLSPRANRHALFIMLYRDYPLLQLPYELIGVLLDIDALMGQWRSRHLNMVKRMIGSRIGTGGSTGAGYLKSAMDSHFIYKEFAELTSYLIQRNKLPELDDSLKQKLMFSN
ncbi:MAG: tryptophan 2,3-dioxygenase family protein [Bacteroidota bacterium]|nr:tryptophan 2,3-dioxygenase family protein [Bacteroidota bacterium]